MSPTRTETDGLRSIEVPVTLGHEFRARVKASLAARLGEPFLVAENRFPQWRATSGLHGALKLPAIALAKVGRPSDP